MIPMKEGREKEQWMTDEILEMVKRRQETTEMRATEYRTLGTNAGRWKKFNEKCREIERMGIIDTPRVNKRNNKKKDPLIDSMHEIKSGNAHNKIKILER